MSWLEKAKQEMSYDLTKICQLIQDRFSYIEKIDDLRNIYEDVENEKVNQLFFKAKQCLEEWKNGPMFGLNIPRQIISDAENYKKVINALITEINKELFPC
ncbi:MAG: hypothetical protein Q7J14_00050 [Candidatus Magasanikbacteria bacterium]|nr:hypothetical protein [Candidatus Magasanikbacteria bacterium]